MACPALPENRYYQPASCLKPFWQCIKCSFSTAPVASGKEAIARIEALSGVRLSESQACRVMKQMGMVLCKVAPVPGKADAQLQFTFYERELLPRLEEAGQGKRKVFFVDAAHFVLGAFLGMNWCMSRVFLKTAAGRQRYSVLGAVESHGKELISNRTAADINRPLSQ